MKTARPLFSARIVTGWLAAAAAACAVSFSFMTRDDAGSHRLDESGPTIYSRSALGYAALFRTLPELGIPVGEGTAAAGPQRDAAVLVIAEANRDERALAHVRDALRTAPAVLFVLPKRTGRPDPNHPGRIRRDALLPLDEVETVLALVDDTARVERRAAAGSWSGPMNATPTTRRPQLVQSAKLTPLLGTDGGMLVGEMRRDGRRTVVVSDPDVLENHGLARGDNALIAVALIRSLRGKSTERVVFDEAAHGIVSHPFGTLRLLFDFPFVLVTLQIAIAAALLVWSAAARFGAPKALAPALALGKQSLIESGSRLFAFAGRADFLAARYADAVMRETAARLHAPRGLAGEELAAWLAQRGRPLPAAAQGAAQDLPSALAAARAMYLWRNDVLDEFG